MAAASVPRVSLVTPGGGHGEQASAYSASVATTPYRGLMAITSVTRRALVADLAARGYAWCGALEEQDFLCRLYPLERMPSKDIRYDNAVGRSRSTPSGELRLG